LKIEQISCLLYRWAGAIFLLNGLEVEDGDRDQAALTHQPQQQTSSTKE
jgi:hypothetical protein